MDVSSWTAVSSTGRPAVHALGTIAGVTLTLRKLSREETARAFARRGQTDVSEYVAALRALQIGDSAEIALEGLSSGSAKRRLSIAATQVGYQLKWAPAQDDDRLYFRVLPAAAIPAGRIRSGRPTRSPVAQPATPTPATSDQPAATPAPARARRRRAARTS
jgi:hypothetical protein